MGTATLEFLLGQHSATTWTTGASSLSGSIEFANAVQPYTNAAIRRVGFTVSDDLENVQRDDAFADLSLYGMAFFRDSEYKIVKFVWPAPRRDLFDLTNGRYVLKTATGETLATALGTLKGATLTFKHGGVCSR